MTSFVPTAPNIPGPLADTRRPRVKFPAGACDCHAHVFDWIPDEALRNRIFAANPARLYGF